MSKHVRENEVLQDASARLEQQLDAALARIESLKEENQRLKEDAAQYKSIAENTPGVVFVYTVSPEGKRTKSSTGPGLSDIIGEKLAEKADQDIVFFFSLIPEEDRKRIEKKSLEIEKTGQTFDIEYRLIGENSSVHWVRSISKPVSLGDGWYRWQGILIDITDRKYAESIQNFLLEITEATAISADLKSLIKTCRKSLGRLLDTTNFYVALYDEESQTYSFPYYEDAHDELEEYSSLKIDDSLTDLVRRTATPHLFSADQFADVEEKYGIALVGTDSKVWMGAPLISGEKAIGVVAVQSYDDKYLYTDDDLDLLTKVAQYIAVAVERKRAQLYLRESDKLRTAREMAYTVAHEFRQPLTSLVLIADLMEKSENIDEPTRKMMNKIALAVARIDELVDKLVSITHVKSKEYAMGIDIVDLDESCD